MTRAAFKAVRLWGDTRSGGFDSHPLPPSGDLILNIVSGPRTEGGAARHVGGANRTIIKLARQLLINLGVNLADPPARRGAPHGSISSTTSSRSGGIETEEQLAAALAGLREECARLIGAGQKVLGE